MNLLIAQCTKRQGFDSESEKDYVGYNVDSHNPDDNIKKLVLIFENYGQISSNLLDVFKNNWDNIVLEYIEINKNTLNK